MDSTAYNLTPELWSIIFSYCVEPHPTKKRQVSQANLVKLLQVNSTFFSLAAPFLYRNATIEDLGGFLLGADEKISTPPRLGYQNLSDIEFIRLGQTKIPLLRYIRNLTIDPYTLATHSEITGSSALAYDTIIETQQSSYFQAKSILKDISSSFSTACQDLHIQSITIGTSEFTTNKEIDRIKSRFFCEIHSIRRNLLELFRPKIWCEYSPLHGYCFEPLQSDFEQEVGVDKRKLPDRINIHTTLEGTFPLVWGTTNRIMIRRTDDDLRKLIDNNDALDDPNSNDDIDTNSNLISGFGAPTSYPMINSETIPEEFDMKPIPSLTEEELIRRLVYTIIRSIPPWLRRLPEEKQEYIDQRTKLEIYGLEKVMLEPPAEEDTIDNPNGRAGTIIELRCDALLITQHLQFKRLKRMEAQIRSECRILENGRWEKTSRKAPVIGLFLAVENPGCEACAPAMAP